VHVPAAASSGLRCAYRKARTRAAMDFPLAGVACALTLQAGAIASMRLAITGTNAQPFLLAGCDTFAGRRVDAELLAQLGKSVQKQVSPMRSTVTPSNYRRLAAAALAQRLLRDLAARGD
jgi:4-hydroxybenzoyl-CoA reductase subunit beta